MEEEIHFVCIDYNERQAVMASSEQEALEKADNDGMQNPSHICTESEMKEHFEDNEVLYL